MTHINKQDLLDEIRYDIKVKDLLKARLVLSSLDKVDKDTQKTALFEVSRADDDFAIPLIAGVIANSQDVSKSFPLLKEALISKVLDSPQVLLDLFSKGDGLLDRGFLAEIAGEIRLEKAVPVLLGILNEEKDLEAIEKVILSLGMIGDPSAVGPVSEFLSSDHREMVIASVLTLGELATPEAIQKLAAKLGGDPDIDLMILDIFAKGLVPDALEKLTETLGSQYAHIRTAGKQRLGEIGVMAARVLVRNLLSHDSDLVLHSLNVLGDIGNESSIPAISKLLHNEPKDPNVRFAAYEALGRLPLEKGAYVLAVGLEDPVDNVRAAAAKAIDRHYTPILAAGIKNLTRSGNAEAMKIMLTIINSQCDNIFLGLLEEDFFQAPAIKYLADNAHPDISSHFAELLNNEEYNNLADQISSQKTTKDKAKLKVFAVDDSKMILNIYRSFLHNLGYGSQLFEFPAVALERLREEKPDVILTDLNMPDITGIDFTRSIRQLYSEEDLPVIMVTTQDEAKDHKAAHEAGVNDIMQKPFTEEQIGKALGKFF